MCIRSRTDTYHLCNSLQQVILRKHRVSLPGCCYNPNKQGCPTHPKERLHRLCAWALGDHGAEHCRSELFVLIQIDVWHEGTTKAV